MSLSGNTAVAGPALRARVVAAGRSVPNSRIRADLLWSALRVGNPEACAAFNDGSLCCGSTAVVVPGQDYLAGETEVVVNGRTRFGGRSGADAPLLDAYWLRTEFVGVTGRVFQALGIVAPPAVRRAEG